MAAWIWWIKWVNKWIDNSFINKTIENIEKIKINYQKSLEKQWVKNINYDNDLNWLNSIPLFLEKFKTWSKNNNLNEELNLSKDKGEINMYVPKEVKIDFLEKITFKSSEDIYNFLISNKYVDINLWKWISLQLEYSDDENEKYANLSINKVVNWTLITLDDEEIELIKKIEEKYDLDFSDEIINEDASYNTYTEYNIRDNEDLSKFIYDFIIKNNK